MIRIILWVVIAGAGLVLALYFAGLLMPARHLARAELNIEAPPRTLAALIREAEGLTRWRSGISKVRVVRQTDTYAEYIEYSRHGATPYRLIMEPDQRHFTITITDEDLPFGGEWRIELLADGHGTRVVIEENGRINNPLFRLIAGTVFGYDRSIRAYLDDLSAGARAYSPGRDARAGLR